MCVWGTPLVAAWLDSLGGWAEAEQLRLKDQDHIKSDERILGDLDFVDSVLAQAEEPYTRQCSLRRRGYNLEKIAERVAEIYGILPCFLGHTPTDEPGGGWLCGTKGRGYCS